MDEKKLTDEEIANAIVQSIEYSKTITYFDEWGNCKSIIVADILDLIHRLQSENEQLRNAKTIYESVDYCADDLAKALKTISEQKAEIERLKEKFSISHYRDSWKNKFFKAQEEIERLAEAHKKDSMLLYASGLACEQVKAENTEIQKQVEKLMERCEIAEGTKSRLTIFDRIEIHDKAVKDTAREILDELYHKNYEIDIKVEDYELHEKAIEIVSKAMLKALNERMKAVAERYGVEVE